MHEPPRLAALSSLTANATSGDSSASPSLRGVAQSVTAVLSGLDRYLPQEGSAEEAAGLLASSATVLDTPGEPLRYHAETAKASGDTKMAAKVTKWRRDCVPIQVPFGGPVYVPNANMCVDLSSSRARR